MSSSQQRHIIRHIGVYGIVILRDKVLAIRKSRGPYKGMLDLPGGKPEHGETPSQTLRREFLEETNCRIDQEILHTVQTALADWIYDGKDATTYHIGIYFRVVLQDPSELKEDGDGHDSLGAQWISLTEEHILQFAPIAQKVLRSLKAAE